MAARKRLWVDDGLGGLGHTLPYLIKEFYLATWASIAVVEVGVSGDLLDSASLHGYPASFRHFPGSFGWSSGLYNRYFNRLCLAAVQHTKL
jgi:hypothetical protein